MRKILSVPSAYAEPGVNPAQTNSEPIAAGKKRWVLNTSLLSVRNEANAVGANY
jgi:hypothetical protein